MNENYKCVLSLGIRCYTEIFLKQLGLKNFSSPFDGLYLSSIRDIIYLLENRIEHEFLIHTQDDEKYKSYNKKWGFRTIHQKFMMNMNDINSSYHYATFAHHNLKDKNIVAHFERCFDRLDVIKEEKIKTLFCLFLHPYHGGYVPVKQEDILKLSDYLKNLYNCHLLCIYFQNTTCNELYTLLKETDNYSIYRINNSSWNFDCVKHELVSIFKRFNVKKEHLIYHSYFNLKRK